MHTCVTLSTGYPQALSTAQEGRALFADEQRDILLEWSKPHAPGDRYAPEIKSRISKIVCGLLLPPLPPLA